MQRHYADHMCRVEFQSMKQQQLPYTWNLLTLRYQYCAEDPVYTLIDWKKTWISKLVIPIIIKPGMFEAQTPEVLFDLYPTEGFVHSPFPSPKSASHPESPLPQMSPNSTYSSSGAKRSVASSPTCFVRENHSWTVPASSFVRAIFCPSGDRIAASTRARIC